VTSPPAVPLPRAIRHGTRGPDVVGAKRALSRAGYMQWGRFTPMWGDFAVTAAKRFQAANGIQQTGNYGKATHEKLVATKRKGRDDEWAWDAFAVNLMEGFAERFDDRPEAQIRLAIADAAMYWSSKRSQIHYVQSRPFALLAPPEIPRELDCSGFVTLCHKAAGARNPNVMGGKRMPWNGHGYTGTLMAGGSRCSKISELQPGDCVFYGATANPSAAFPVGSPTHVALYVGGGMVVTHGKESGPEHKSWNYWSAVNCLMRYDVLPEEPA
jgi:cell wall-associated NlpC family hydrolase